jgi:hypothetical protein
MSEARALERVGDDQRHEPDHRRFGREVLQLLDVGVERELVALSRRRRRSGRRPCAGAVEALERRVELGRNRDQRRTSRPVTIRNAPIV